MINAAHLHESYIALDFTWFDMPAFYANRYSHAYSAMRRQAARNQQARIYNEQMLAAAALKASWHLTTDDSPEDDRRFEDELARRHANGEWLGVGGIQL